VFKLWFCVHITIHNSCIEICNFRVDCVCVEMIEREFYFLIDPVFGLDGSHFALQPFATGSLKRNLI
jgi:hypothetical protein